jgi:hypothetical protein
MAIDTWPGRSRRSRLIRPGRLGRRGAGHEIGRLFARHGYELALVGGPVRDVFLGRPATGDLDLTTDAVPERVLEITTDWADKTWTVGIAFGTIGLRKRDDSSRSPPTAASSTGPVAQARRAVRPSLEEDLERRDFTINAMAARLPGVRARRSVRRPGRAEGEGAADARAAGGLVQRRPAAHPAGGPVRRPAGLRRRARRARGHDDQAPGCRSCRSSGSPTS